MERLTKRLSNGNATWNYPIICFGEEDSRNKVFKSVHRQKACEKLAAYEETGLEPEEIIALCDMDRRAKIADMLRLEESAGISIDRLRELAQAKKEGRLVVLPDVKYTDSDGDKALRHAMYMCGVQNNPVTRYTADAIAEKLTREAAEAALKEREVD